MSETFFCWSCRQYKALSLKACESATHRATCTACKAKIDRNSNADTRMVKHGKSRCLLEKVKQQQGKKAQKQYTKGYVPPFAKD